MVYNGNMATTPTMNDHALAVGSTFVWHEAYGPDPDAIVDFYTKALDFGTQNYDMGEMGTYRMLTKNGVGVAGVLGTNTPEMKDVPPHWATYVAVDDVDARLAKCQSLGAKLVHGPMNVPSVGRMVLIQDPQGAHIWLFKPDPAAS